MKNRGFTVAVILILGAAMISGYLTNNATGYTIHQRTNDKNFDCQWYSKQGTTYLPLGNLIPQNEAFLKQNICSVGNIKKTNCAVSYSHTKKQMNFYKCDYKK